MSEGYAAPESRGLGEEARQAVYRAMFPTYGQEDGHRTSRLTDSIVAALDPCFRDAERAGWERARREIADQMETEIRPLINEDRFRGGYDCCGCSTYDAILDHAIRIARPGALPEEDE